jgi:alpha-galactosidase/6-phospho-beta-glucosidase family protein
MKAVFVGGGAHRLIPILRAVLAEPAIFDGGEIYLLDLDVTRAEAVGRVLQQTPEYRQNNVKIVWGDSLDQALPGADVVSVILMGGSPLSMALSMDASLRHGFIPSDNVSACGGLLAVKTAPILLNLAQRMERACPDAWLLDFANPVAVLSGMINRHTEIKALGVCAGFTNHQWDLSRIFGKDERRQDVDVDCVGINHLSFIVDGRFGGRDLFEQLDLKLSGEWKMCELSPLRTPGCISNITRSVENLVRFYRELGVLVFSTEGDGLMHLRYDETLAKEIPREFPSRCTIEARVEKEAGNRRENNQWFEEQAKQHLDDAFWAQHNSNTAFSRVEDDIFVRILRGIAGVDRVKIATSRLNQGAIEGFPDDAVVEYSQWLYKDRITAVGRHKVPDIVHGLISGLCVHQTMLGDACATGDPKLLAHALLAYPMRPFSKEARELYRDLIVINRAEIPKSFLEAVDYLR